MTPRMRIGLIVFAFCAAHAMTAGISWAQSHEETISADQFVAKYPQRAARLIEFYRHLSMEVRASSYRHDGIPAFRVSDEQYASSGDRLRRISDRVVTDHPEIPPKARQVRVAHPDVSFFLTREAGGSDYVTQRIEDHSGAEFSIRLYAKPLVAPFSYLELTLAEFMQQEGFRVENVSETTDSETGERVAKVFWDHPFTVAENTRVQRSGWFAFLPDSAWALKEIWIKQRTVGVDAPPEDHGLIRCVIDYQGATDGIPHVSNVRLWTEAHHDMEMSIETPRRVPINIEEYEVLEFSTKELPPEEFTLAAFGIPTPGAPGSGRGRLFLWVNLGLILLVIGLLLYRLAKKRDEQTGRPRTI